MDDSGGIEWCDEPPTWQEVNVLCVRRINEKLNLAGLNPLSSRTMNLLWHCATDKQTHYILHDAADGPLHNINKRIQHRIGKQERLVRGGRWNENGSEEDMSSDDSHGYQSPRHSADALRPLPLPLSYYEMSSESDQNSDAVEVPATRDAE